MSHETRAMRSWPVTIDGADLWWWRPWWCSFIRVTSAENDIIVIRLYFFNSFHCNFWLVYCVALAFKGHNNHWLLKQICSCFKVEFSCFNVSMVSGWHSNVSISSSISSVSWSPATSVNYKILFMIRQNNFLQFTWPTPEPSIWLQWVIRIQTLFSEILIRNKFSQRNVQTEKFYNRH